MPSPLDVAIMALATWRLSSLLTYERGPAHVFQRLRAAAGIMHDDHGRPNVIPETFSGELLSCLWCASMYVGAAVVLMYVALGALAIWLLLPLALSAAAIWLNRSAHGAR